MIAGRVGSSAALISAALLGLLVTGCGDEPPPPTPPKPVAKPSDPALELDGVVITRRQIEELMPYFRELDPTMGRNKCIRTLLDRHLIPLAFARREFAAEREAQRVRAEGLAKALGQAGYDDAVDHTRRMPDAEIQTSVIRQKLPIVEQRWLFDDLTVGRVSPVLETAQGYSLVAASAKHPGVTTAYDRVDALLVRFFHQRSKAHSSWRTALAKRLSSLAKDAVFVHPDYRDALPLWLTRAQTP